MWNTNARTTDTTLECRRCGKHLIAQRGCRNVTLGCRDCGATYLLKDYASQMDEALEEFLSSHFCDRC